MMRVRHRVRCREGKFYLLRSVLRDHPLLRAVFKGWRYALLRALFKGWRYAISAEDRFWKPLLQMRPVCRAWRDALDAVMPGETDFDALCRALPDAVAAVMQQQKQLLRVEGRHADGPHYRVEDVKPLRIRPVQGICCNNVDGKRSGWAKLNPTVSPVLFHQTSTHAACSAASIGRS